MTAILEVLIGLLLVFLVFSIVVSGVQEWWSQYFGHRGKFLRQGLMRLIDDEALYIRVLHHPLVGGLYRDRAARGKPPAYIEPKNFALAFANVLTRRANPPETKTSQTGPQADADVAAATQVLTFESLRNAVVNVAAQRSPVAYAVLPILDEARGSLDDALKGIEAWFNSGMDRVSGWYRAYAQKRLFMIGLVLAILGNVDSIAIFQKLNTSPALRAQIAELATKVEAQQKLAGIDLSGAINPGSAGPTANETRALVIAAMETRIGLLPIGYGCIRLQQPGAVGAAMSEAEGVLNRCRNDANAYMAVANIPELLIRLLGWIITALAGVLGAPYWFAALSRVINIRGSGTKPATPQSSK